MGNGLIVARLRPVGDRGPFVDVEPVVGDVAHDVCVGGAKARCKSGSGGGGLGTLERRKWRGGGLVGWCLGNERVSMRKELGGGS